MNCNSAECSEQASRGGYCDDHQSEHFKELELEIMARKGKKGTEAKPTSSLSPNLPKKASNRRAGTPRRVTPCNPPTSPAPEIKAAKPAEEKKTVELCTFPGCKMKQKKVNANRLCPWHRYHQLVGLELQPRPAHISAFENCHWPGGCDKRIANCGFCSSHKSYLRSIEKKTENEEELIAAIQERVARDKANQKSPGLCVIEDCLFPVVKTSLISILCGQCLTNYREWLAHTLEQKPVTTGFSPQQIRAFEKIQQEKEAPSKTTS